MKELRTRIDHVVRAGIQAYIGLLCAGEQVRSRRLFTDVLQISSFASGGPSARLPVSLEWEAESVADAVAETSGEEGRIRLARCLIYYTLRSVLASLLVLRATVYWQRVPALVELQIACARLNGILGAEPVPTHGNEGGDEAHKGRYDKRCDELCSCTKACEQAHRPGLRGDDEEGNCQSGCCRPGRPVGPQNDGNPSCTTAGKRGPRPVRT